jgi:hypothetical protein
MPNIFGADIAGAIFNALGPLVFDQTLVKISSVRDVTDKTHLVKTKTPYTNKGFVDSFDTEEIDGSLIKRTDRKISILGASLATGIIPEPGDEIIAEGSTFTIVSDGVSRDPAGALYECHVR